MNHLVSSPLLCPVPLWLAGWAGRLSIPPERPMYVLMNVCATLQSRLVSYSWICCRSRDGSWRGYNYYARLLILCALLSNNSATDRSRPTKNRSHHHHGWWSHTILARTNGRRDSGLAAAAEWKKKPANEMEDAEGRQNLIDEVYGAVRCADMEVERDYERERQSLCNLSTTEMKWIEDFGK